MERIINDLQRQIHELKQDNQKIKATTNFLLYSIVEVLDQQPGDEKFSEALKDYINNELSKITMQGSVPTIKHAINEFMKPPIRPMFGQSQSEPFLK